MSCITSLRKNWFLLGLLGALIVGFLLPEWGARLNPDSLTSTVVVMVLFFIAGVTLPSERVIHGISHVRLHLYIQGFIFVAIPLFFFFTSIPFRGYLDGKVVIGIYALACLPTTISSCNVFTQTANGNVAGTMFNSSLANVMGIFISPLILSLMLSGSGAALPPEEIIRILKNLVIKMFVPIIIGQVARLRLHQWVDTGKKKLNIISNALILSIIFFAFSRTADNPVFLSNLEKMLIPFLYLAIAHLVLVFLSYQGSRLISFTKEDRISITFTAPQKTLAMGVPLLTTYFSDNLELLGIVMLPLIFYHSWQLFIAGFLRSMRFLYRG
jgi:sodium/bile acid cotransporter 7